MILKKIKHEWELLNHQKFIKFFSNKYFNNWDKLFLFHSTGSGKTCSSVVISEEYIKYMSLKKKKLGYIYIIASFFSHNEFFKTLNSPCYNIANNYYFDDFRYKYLKYESVEDFISDKNNIYKMMSYQKFGYSKILNKIPNFDNSLIIIDEAHNLLNNNKFFMNIKKILQKSKNYKLVLLTATPMYNVPDSIFNFIDILHPHDKLTKKIKMFNKSGNLKKEFIQLLYTKFIGKISYINTYNPIDFPIVNYAGKIPSIFKHTKIVQIPISQIQFSAYKKYFRGKLKNDIKNILNFVIPSYIKNKFIFTDIQRNIAKAPQVWRKKHQIDSDMEHISGRALDYINLKKYSAKYARCLKDIIETKSGLTMIYSHFVHNNGIFFFADILRRAGFEKWENIESNKANMKGTRHYKTNELYEHWIKRTNRSKKYISAKLFFSRISIN